MVLFGIGSGAIALSALIEDLIRFFNNKQEIAISEQNIKSMQDLIAVHDELLGQLHRDPNMIKRLAPAIIGTQEQDPNTAYPLTGLQELGIARRMLANQKKSISRNRAAMPNWLIRCREPRRRTALFLAGGVLVLISFACFGLVQPPDSLSDE